MTKSKQLQIRLSEIQQRLAELSGIDEPTDEQRSEMNALTAEYQAKQTEYRAAVVAEETELEARRAEFENGDGETAERRALRSRANVGRFFEAAVRGRVVDGAEAELAQAAGVEDRGIPLELWNAEPRHPNGGTEDRAITPAPATVGVNLDVLRPAVFAPSVVDKLMVDMPMVESGTFASGTITTSATADAVAKSAEVPETEAAFTVTTTKPHRIGGSLNLAIEDIAAIGQANFEPLLRQHISLVLSDELDDQLLNGDDKNDDLSGFFKRLDDPGAPAANVETWERFVTAQADGVDGLWATELSHIALVVGVDTYKLMASKVRTGNAADQTALEHLTRVGGGVSTNKRMPAKDNHIQQGLLCRKGRPGIRTAVAPHWGYVAIDDIYTGARKGERRFVVSVLVGDLILVQPAAYAQVSFRVST